MNTEKYICIRYPDNKCDRMPRSEAEKLVDAGKAVFTTKSRYHQYLNQEAKEIETSRRVKVREEAKKKRALSKKPK